MTRERLLEIIRFCMVGGVSLALDYAILYALFEAELAAACSTRVWSLLDEKNIRAVNFAALEAST